MGVRPMRLSDRAAVLDMRLLLWPDDDGLDDPTEEAFVWEENESIGGFISYSLRPWAEGCTARPVPYIEGLFVREHLRRCGIAGALVAAVEDKARSGGFRELGSDVDLANRLSLAVHRRLGFEPTAQLQFFRKNLQTGEAPSALSIEPFAGPRRELSALFALADDSTAAIQHYIELGEVLVARRAQQIIGHVQLTTGSARSEIKSVAVIPEQQGRGIGAALVRAALDRAFSAGASRVLVATAAADLDNLRFYQRLGFRMERIQRDAFTVENGYPALVIDGIPLRDQVWLSITGSDPR